ncbi:PREDICTED: histamine N-methyltransferase-like [Branchiostoma belcheri]|uniref:Histamine N-methyltransferase-like n=1 Tax=Branchiostoma belcheri TaxID=7741 RepID=A0A6P5ANT9_BRABE|nr:PREDICTED: histamine N-methyltransferase-like [Branchiostoma belcheri]
MAGWLKIGKLHLSPERYVASFRTYRAAKEVNLENYFQFYGSNVPDTIPCESGVRVLGIGSGSGEIDSVILKRLLQRHNNVYSRVVEPSEEMIGRYKSLVREDASLGAVEFDWRQQTAEEYFTTKEDTTFHLIHAIHVLYHVEDLHATLRNTWEQLADGGCLFIAMQSDKSGWGNMWKTMRETFIQDDPLNTRLRHSGDVKQCLDAMAISYVTSEDESHINVTECLKEDSETGSLLLDFLTQTPDVSNEPQIKSVVQEHIRRNCSVIDGRTLLQSINEIIIAFKSG